MRAMGFVCVLQYVSPVSVNCEEPSRGAGDPLGLWPGVQRGVSGAIARDHIKSHLLEQNLLCLSLA